MSTRFKDFAGLRTIILSLTLRPPRAVYRASIKLRVPRPSIEATPGTGRASPLRIRPLSVFTACCGTNSCSQLVSNPVCFGSRAIAAPTYQRRVSGPGRHLPSSFATRYSLQRLTHFSPHTEFYPLWFTRLVDVTVLMYQAVLSLGIGASAPSDLTNRLACAFYAQFAIPINGLHPANRGWHGVSRPLAANVNSKGILHSPSRKYLQVRNPKACFPSYTRHGCIGLATAIFPLLPYPVATDRSLTVVFQCGLSSSPLSVRLSRFR